MDPILAPHLESLNVTEPQVGLYFLAIAGPYAVCSPLMGYLADRIRNPLIMMVVGLILMTIAILLLGPTPLLPFLNKGGMSLVLGSLIFLGFAASITVIPALASMLGSFSADEKRDEATADALSAILGGIMGTCISLSSIIGPSAGGFLVEYVSFGWALTIFAGGMIFFGSLPFLYWAVWASFNKTSKQMEPRDLLFSKVQENKAEVSTTSVDQDEVPSATQEKIYGTF